MKIHRLNLMYSSISPSPVFGDDGCIDGSGLVIGLIFVSLGIFGLLRLPDVYNRLHATSKIKTLGAFGVMLSIFVKVGFAPMGVKAITVGIFLMLTVPVSAHMISRAAHRHGVNMCEESVVDEYGETYK